MSLAAQTGSHCIEAQHLAKAVSVEPGNFLCCSGTALPAQRGAFMLAGSLLDGLTSSSRTYSEHTQARLSCMGHTEYSQ